MKSQHLYFSHTAGRSPILDPVSSCIGQLGIRKTAEQSPMEHPVHSHKGIELCYVIKEPHQWKLGQRDYELLPGEIFMTCPWQEHACLNGPFDRGYMGWIEIIPETFTRDGRLKLGNWSHLAETEQETIGRLLATNGNPVIPTGIGLADIIRDINSELEHQRPFYMGSIHLMLDSIMIHIARSLIERRDETQRDDDFINAIRLKMEENLANKVNIGDFAYSFGMSPSSFNNKVKSLLGTSPAVYMIGLRIQKAKELLATTDWTVTRISTECGFYSSQYFAKLFLEREGLRPLEYRKAILSRTPSDQQ